MGITDLRSDFYKFLDVIKHTMNEKEYAKFVRQNTRCALDVLKDIENEGGG